MRTNRAGKVVLAVVALFLFIVVGGQVVMHLWNWLLPSLFGWRMLTFWQALGLLALCRILFGSFGGHRRFSRSDFRQRMNARWEHMTPEERERFGRGMRGGCGPFGNPPATEAKP